MSFVTELVNASPSRLVFAKADSTVARHEGTNMNFSRIQFMSRCAVAMCALLCGTQLATASDADAAKQFNLIGNWAGDCAVPPAPDNPHQNFAVAADGSIALTMKSGGKAADTVITIRDLEPVGADMIKGQWSAPKGPAMTVTLQKQGNKIHSWESSDATGKKFIDKGTFVAINKLAPWASKCS
jgi:hypothetical protein